MLLEGGYGGDGGMFGGVAEGDSALEVVKAIGLPALGGWGG